jgi:hypothetical protein
MKLSKKKEEKKEEFKIIPMCERCAININKMSISEARKKGEWYAEHIELLYHDDILKCKICDTPTCSYHKEEIKNDKKS